MSQTLAEHIQTANEQLLEQGNVAATEAFFSPAYIAHGTDREFRGLDFVKGFVDQLRSAFPDLRVDVDALVSEGHRVAWQRTFRATHQAAFGGFPASGRTIRWRDMVVSRFEDGLIAEDWVVSDLAERLLAARH